jgi:hypothetical protein
MKLYGSLERLVSILFRKDSQDITVRPNQATTYTAARDIQLPAGDAAHVLVSRDSTDTLINKTIDADQNTITNIENADIKSGAAIDAAKIADGSVSSTEFQYLSGVTSDIQTQINGKQADVITTEGDLIVGNSSGDAARLAIGTSGYVLTSDGTTASWQAPGTSFDSFAADWVTADTATKVVTHNLGTKDVQVEIYDKTDDSTIWIDSVVRTDTNSVTLTASEAPGAAGWRVTVHAV